VRGDVFLNTLGFVYARSDSARLPNKPFLPLAGLPMIDVVMRRVAEFFEPILLTTDRSVDDDLAGVVVSLGYQVVRGDANDLVQRTMLAIETTGADQFVRINGDSPLVDASLLSKLALVSDAHDMTTNLTTRSFPYGVAVEIILSNWYQKMALFYNINEAEHVTQHLYKQMEQARFQLVLCQNDYQTHRFTVDTDADYEFMKDVFGEAQSVTDVHWWDVVGVEKRPAFTLHSLDGMEGHVD
jgi:spore coat polysaccharide biosynthesis protein SpsF (cytidylyltransferase family)